MAGTIAATRLATASDAATLLDLFEEMERHYAPQRVFDRPAIAQRIEAALFGPRPIGEAMLASVDGRVAGFALFAPLFPAGALRIEGFIKDIWVTRDARRRGVATALVRAVAALAVERGWQRLGWTTDWSNAAARALYAELGVPVLEKNYYRLEDAALADFARG